MLTTFPGHISCLICIGYTVRLAWFRLKRGVGFQCNLERGVLNLLPGTLKMAKTVNAHGKSVFSVFFEIIIIDNGQIY